MEPNAILSESLSLSSDIPLYAQLVGIIKRSISSGALAIGGPQAGQGHLCGRPQHQSPGRALFLHH